LLAVTEIGYSVCIGGEKNQSDNWLSEAVAGDTPEEGVTGRNACVLSASQLG